MKKLIRLCTLLMVLVLMVNLAATVLAEGTVSYDADAKDFIFEPGTRHSPTSLFENFQNVMPGDTRTDQILIRNDKSNKVKIKLYMRSLGAQENTDDFLSQMDLTVRQRGDSILFAGPADRTGDLTNWTYLGTIYSGGKITLDLTLEVPITMGDEYQNDIGYIDWQFKIETLPVEPSDPQPPKTGDDSLVFVFAGLMVVSFVALIILLIVGKRRKKEADKT